jgi:hypothetical protein
MLCVHKIVHTSNYYQHSYTYFIYNIIYYNLINTVLTAINNKKKIGGIFFDLEKASDCVNHKILLYKLEFYGITDTVYTVELGYNVIKGT